MQIKRARIALVVLCILMGVSLVAELICNSKPLYLRLNGRSFLPFVQNLTQRDLLGPEAEPSAPNYHALVASEAFTGQPGNRVVWAPVRYSPGDVVDARTLRACRTVNVSVVPEIFAGRLHVLRTGTIVMPLSCEAFFPGVTRIEGQALAHHWVLPETLRQALQERFEGRQSAAVEGLARQVKDPAVQVRVRLPAVPPQKEPRPVETVLLAFRQVNTPDLPFQLHFRMDQQEVYPVERARWQALPEALRRSIQELAVEAFKGTAPTAVLPWKQGKVSIACSLSEIAWPYRPIAGHWMGIDAAGRDVFARILYGMRIAMIFGMVLSLWAMLGGLVIGAIQGYFGGWVDIAGQRLTEIWSALPFLYVMIFIGSALGRSFGLLLFCYSLFNWIGISYYMRAEFLRLRNQTFVEAARCQGLSAVRIIFGHILPNALTPMITLFPFSLLGAIGSLAALDFLGFGLPPLTPSWGELLQQAQMFRWAWWLILFPSLALFSVMLLTVLIGEGLRDAFDPRQQSKME